MVAEGTRVRLCGRFSVEIAGEPVEGRLRGAQSRALVAYLVAHRHRAVRRDELLEALWPGAAGTGTNRSSLTVILSRLRPALAPAEIHGRDELTLALPEPVWIDVEVARARVADAAAHLAAGAADAARAAAREALVLVEPGPAVDAEGPWVDALAADLDDLTAEGREHLVRAALDLGDGSAEATRAAHALAAAAPFRESAHLLLMRALVLRGDVAEALRVYEALRARLRDELGTAPGAALRAAHAELLAAAERPGPALPAPPLVAAATGTALVGRDAPLGALTAAWRAACAGRGRTVVVAGEAGVGKTRLAEELARHVLADGGTVLYGRASEETLAPYEPWIEALRPWERSAPRAEVERRAEAGLAPLLPSAWPDADDTPDRDATVPDDHGRRFRLHEAAGDLLVELAGRAPLLVLLDDLHWADAPSIRLLRAVLRAGAGARLLVVGTLRTHDTPPQGVLTDALADLARAGVLDRLDLSGLDPTGVGALIRTLTGRPPPEALVRDVHDATRGNPFFVGEVVRHLGETDAAGTVPPGVRATISQRVGRLDPEVQRLLAIGSVLGREFDLDLLA